MVQKSPGDVIGSRACVRVTQRNAIHLSRGYALRIERQTVQRVCVTQRYVIHL